ncbi:hypothetical protein COT97_01520 [Candidatus Falkowbacteria bacterium CG10_big_fil_rev_8_21_14_0_10_39_11]|uniref:Uncharacterized protein n=1 Tax=Candidatus Falkowbacteria bacterium CG10_big_fil_rev_8_21_14_0_10_39_11 TaxID=1974565 RepID=A0A2H0V5H1_9BACT|nr:MAG: hypothetical protein COT97_01520 [Candidatus Falkowbacteria bacterium CG10_big_fil_rev_8_21_14_0_10_39_11]
MKEKPTQPNIKEALMKLPSFEKMFQQLEYFVELYKEAENKTKILERMVKFLPDFESVLEKMVVTDEYSKDTFVDDLIKNDLLESLRKELAGAEDERDFSVGILNIDYNPAERRYVFHVPPYVGDDFKSDFKKSLHLLAQRMSDDENVELMEGYSWIFNVPFINELFKNAKFEDAGDTEKNMNQRDEFSGSQRSALLYNKRSLKEYLKEGTLPETTGRIYEREAFLRDYLNN